MLLEPRADLMPGALTKVRHLKEAGKSVVAIDLDERIQVEEDGGNAGEQHRLVSHRMEEGVRIGRHPEGGRDGADDELDVDSRNRDPQPLESAREQVGIGRVAVKAGVK